MVYDEDSCDCDLSIVCHFTPLERQLCQL